ncbi:MAG: hypothetical protein SAJ72_06820 [Jaaginema sp. PMC 1080.18]|nr:hypothetical protein [Jaaginema sp. PMC 1080.18]MEC4867909.1 hypothetical protein [Jaaginema sp. PMC 1078.18]
MMDEELALSLLIHIHRNNSESAIACNDFKVNIMQQFDFVKIGEDTLTIKDVIAYLKSSGGLGQFLSTILREHIVSKEIQVREFCPSDTEVEQFILDFRLQNGIAERGAFEQWLKDNQLSYEKFREQAVKGLNFQKLREQLAQDKIEPFFTKKGSLFDRLVLSRLVVEDSNLATKIAEILRQDTSQFKTLVLEYSIAEDRVLDGRMGVFPREDVPTQLQSELEGKVAGDIVGPVVVDGLSCFFKVDRIIAAELDDSLRREIEDVLFEEWLRGKMQGSNLQILV